MTWDDESSDPNEHYWKQYDSIEEAVVDSGEVEVFVAHPKSIGRYKRSQIKVVQVKRRKKKKVKR